MQDIQDLQTEFWVLATVGFSVLFIGLLTLIQENMWGVLPIVTGLGFLLFALRAVQRMKVVERRLTQPAATDITGQLIARVANADAEAMVELREAIEGGQLRGGTYLAACRAMANALEQASRSDDALAMASRVLEKFAGDASMRRLRDRLGSPSTEEQE